MIFICTFVKSGPDYEIYITYNVGKRDLPNIYALTLEPLALRLGHIYQANPSLGPGLLCSNFTYYTFEQCSKKSPIMLNIMP